MYTGGVDPVCEYTGHMNVWGSEHRECMLGV